MPFKIQYWAMSLEVRFTRKLLLIVLLLCATLNAQASSLTSEQETHKGSQHCCRLCHMGPAPILAAATVSVVAPAVSDVWIIPQSTPPAPREVLLAAAPARAPPA